MARARRLPFVRVRVLRSGERRYQATKRIDGEREYGKLRKTQDEAYADALVLLRDAAKAEQKVAPPTFGDALAMTEEELTVKCAPATVAWFKCHAKVLKRAWSADLPIERITSAGIETFIRTRLATVTGNTVRQALAALRRVLRLAMRRGMLKVSPLEGVDLPALQEAEMDCFAPEEVDVIAAAIEARGDPATADLVRFLFLTGLRRSEVARLTVADVDLAVGVIRVRGKTGRREIPIDADQLAPVAARMIARAQGGSLVGTAYAISGVLKRWQAKLAEPKLHAHALRHSMLTALVRAGHDVDTIRRLAGHRSLVMLTRYLHGHAPAARAAMASLRLGRPAGSPKPAPA